MPQHFLIRAHLAQRLPPQRQAATLAISLDIQTLTAMPVHECVDLHPLGNLS